MNCNNITKVFREGAQFLIHPIASSPKDDDRAKRLVSSVAIGIFTLGTWHLVAAVIIHFSPCAHDKMGKEVANRAGRVSKSATPILVTKPPRYSTSKPKRPIVTRSTVSKQSHLPHYERLIKSLPPRELEALHKRMSEISDDQVEALTRPIHRGQFVLKNQVDNRDLFIIALKALKMGRLSIDQVATLHIIEGAICDLHKAKRFFYKEASKREGKDVNILRNRPLPSQSSLGDEEIQGVHFTTMVNSKGKMIPLLQKVFALNNQEWKSFSEMMRTKPRSEQTVYLMPTSKDIDWSFIIPKIQELTRIFEVIETSTIENLKEFGSYAPRYSMAIPTFSMMQSFLDVKANTFSRPPLRLIPTYYLLENDDYATTKAKEGIPMSLYFPEADQALRYSQTNPRFKALIDGYPHEGPFAALIHDLYHGCREIAMKENVNKGRYHLAKIIASSGLSGREKLSDALVDGELIFSYSDSKTLFRLSSNFKVEGFKALFLKLELRGLLSDPLKLFILSEIRSDEKMWKEEFGLTLKDLPSTFFKIKSLSPDKV